MDVGVFTSCAGRTAARARVVYVGVGDSPSRQPSPIEGAGGCREPGVVRWWTGIGIVLLEEFAHRAAFVDAADGFTKERSYRQHG